MELNSTITRLPRFLLIGIALITLATAEPFVGRLGATPKVDATSQDSSRSQSEYRTILESFYDAVFNLPNLTEARDFIVPEYIDRKPHQSEFGVWN